MGVLAAGGQSFIAIWHTGPVSGASYWLDICLSPEVLIFVFFMMSDPKTAPRTRAGQIVFGAGTAVLAAGLLVLQPTEFGIKVAILASLTVSCALSPLIAAALRRIKLPRVGDALPAREIPSSGSPSWVRSLTRSLREPAIIAAAVIAVAAPIDTIALRSDAQISYIEQGLTGSHNPQ